MRDDDFYGSGERSHIRKRQRADKILNISIGIVLLLILLVGGQFLLGGKSDSPAVSDNLEENDNELTEDENDMEEPTESSDAADLNEEDPQSSNETNEQPSNEEPTEEKETNNEESQLDSPTTDQETENMPPQEGQWEPIGTVQSEPFAAVYDKDHINWAEMKKAFQYATGLGDDIVLWHVGNGGDHESAVGIVANYSIRTTPYKVRIEWVTNEGWMPVSVEQLDENIYIELYSNTSEESQDEEDTTSQ